MDQELTHLLRLLEQHDHLTADSLAHQVRKSEKTVRTRLAALRAELSGSGAVLESKPRRGYWLEIQDPDRFAAWKLAHTLDAGQATPDTAEARLMYLLERFVSGLFFKLADEADKLFVSVKTLSQEMRDAESILNQCGLTVERVPAHGVRAVGDEFSMRKVIMRCLSQYDVGFFDLRLAQEQSIDVVVHLLLELFEDAQLSMSEEALQTFALYLFVMSARRHRGFCIGAARTAPVGDHADRDAALAKAILERMAHEGLPSAATDGEVAIVSAFIAGGEIRRDAFGTTENIVISDGLQKLLEQMLDAIYTGYGVDFGGNLRLRFALGSHLVPFDIRMRYGIEIANPVLSETKRMYPFAHVLAQQASIPLAEHYGHAIAEDEVAYFTILFQMGLDMQRRQPPQSRILLVCATGKASSRFFEYRFRELFADYIKSLSVCSLYELPYVDLSGVDYVFSTVRIDRPFPLPIMQVSNFLDGVELGRVRQRLELGDSDYLLRYYRPELFFAEIEGRHRDDVLAQLCERVCQVRPLPEGFLDSVLERESFGSTDFGNLAALPHPQQLLPDENLVAVAVLKRPIVWHTNEVQLVILTSICDSTNDDSQRFYQATAKLLSDETMVRRVIEGGTFDVFMQTISGYDE